MKRKGNRRQKIDERSKVRRVRNCTHEVNIMQHNSYRRLNGNCNKGLVVVEIRWVVSQKRSVYRVYIKNENMYFPPFSSAPLLLFSSTHKRYNLAYNEKESPATPQLVL